MVKYSLARQITHNNDQSQSAEMRFYEIKFYFYLPQAWDSSCATELRMMALELIARSIRQLIPSSSSLLT